MKIEIDLNVPIYVKKWLFATQKVNARDAIELRRDTLIGATIDLACAVEWTYQHKIVPSEKLVSVKLLMFSNTKNIGVSNNQKVRVAVVLDRMFRAEVVAFIRGYLITANEAPEDWEGFEDSRVQLTKEARYKRPLVIYRQKLGIDDEDIEYDRMRKWFRDASDLVNSE